MPLMTSLTSSRTLLSIVIPTGGRTLTLPYTLQTVLCQFSDDVEILVSDNDKSLGTKTVIDRMGDPRVRYVRTPSRLSMTDHWNFALSASRGEYVLVLGDDDGLLPDAVARVRRIIELHRPDVVYGPLDFYQWPVDGEAGKVTWISRRGVDREVDLLVLRRYILRIGGARWESLPSVYRAFIHRRVLDQLSDGGKYCDSLNPDMYSGFAIAGIRPLIAYRLSYPIAICATSYSMKKKTMPRIGDATEGLLAQHVAEYKDDYLVSLPSVFPRVFNSFAESILLAVSRFPGGEGNDYFNYSAHIAWMISWSHAAKPAEILQFKNQLRPFGFDTFNFSFWYAAYKLRHGYSKFVSHFIARQSSIAGDMRDVSSAAQYLGRCRGDT